MVANRWRIVDRTDIDRDRTGGHAAIAIGDYVVERIQTVEVRVRGVDEAAFEIDRTLLKSTNGTRAAICSSTTSVDMQ